MLNTIWIKTSTSFNLKLLVWSELRNLQWRLGSNREREEEEREITFPIFILLPSPLPCSEWGKGKRKGGEKSCLTDVNLGDSLLCVTGTWILVTLSHSAFCRGNPSLENPCIFPDKHRLLGLPPRHRWASWEECFKFNTNQVPYKDQHCSTHSWKRPLLLLPPSLCSDFKRSYN